MSMASCTAPIPSKIPVSDRSREERNDNCETPEVCPPRLFGAPIVEVYSGFYEYTLGNTFPGWKGTTGLVDVRGVPFLHPGRQELLQLLTSSDTLL